MPITLSAHKTAAPPYHFPTPTERAERAIGDAQREAIRTARLVRHAIRLLTEAVTAPGGLDCIPHHDSLSVLALAEELTPRSDAEIARQVEERMTGTDGRVLA